MFEEEIDEKDMGEKGLSAADLMQDTKMVERYSTYLNKCFFNTSDAFIKKKH